MNQVKYPKCPYCKDHHDGYPAPPIPKPNAWRVPNPRVKSCLKWKPAPPPTQEEIATHHLVQHPPKNRKGRKHKKGTNWLDAKRIHNCDRCQQCNEVTFYYVVIRGNYRIPSVPEMRTSLKTAYIGLWRNGFPGDLIAKILFQVFAEDFHNRELGRPIVKFTIVDAPTTASVTKHV